MILGSIDKFMEYIPTAVGSSPDTLKPFPEEAELRIRDSLPETGLYVLIAGQDETDSLKRHTQAAVCLKACGAGIPFPDPVQTSNGFAVVSNSNWAPAGKEWVERLPDFVSRRPSALLDSIVTLIRSFDEYLTEWKKALAFRFRSETVFLTGAELRVFSGNRQAGCPDLETSRPPALSLQAEVAGHVSAVCMDRLLQKRACGKLSGHEEKVFCSIQTVVGLKMQGKSDYHMIENITGYMTAFPDEFPEYFQSPEYRIKTGWKYENRQSGSTFFFG